MDLINIFRFLQNPIKFLTHLKNTNPGNSAFPLSMPGVPTVWLIANSLDAKKIFTAPIDSFEASKKNPVAPLLGDHGLILQSGKEHLAQRKSFTPFFSKKQVQLFSKNISTIFLKNLESQKASGTLNIQNFSQDNTLKIIIHYLFKGLSEEELDKAETLTHKYLKSYSPSLLFIPKWIPGKWNVFRKAKNNFETYFYERFLYEISKNENSPLIALKEMPKEIILDQIKTMIVAGHETSATSLTWALYYIHQNNFIMNKLLNEELKIHLEDSLFIEDLLANNYLQALVNETLRIQPPVPFITRKIINRDFELGNKSFSPGTEIGVCITLLHRDPLIWPNPESFDPERFINKDFSIYEFAPFGGGTRKCIGADLAILEIKILIGLFLKYYKSELIGKEIPVSKVLQITIGPKKEIYLKYSKK